MKVQALILAAALGALGVSAASAQDSTSDQAAEARRVAVTTCTACHGPQGRSISPKFPRLAGQQATYLVAQMHAFNAHTRGDPDALGYMWGMASTLDDEQIAGLAAYYSAQRPADGTPGDSATIARGKEIYLNGMVDKGIPACAVCHGPNAAGTADFPRLAGQSAQYILKQLGAYQNNLRNVAIMHGVASGLRITEMTALATYLNSLGPQIPN
jgi:cytochrome c553